MDFGGFKGGFSAREDDVCSYPVGELLVWGVESSNSNENWGLLAGTVDG